MWVAFAGCAQPTEPTEPPPALEWTDGPVDGMVLARRFEVEGSGPVSVRCALEGDPDEVHVVVGQAPTTFELYGLLAEATYTCTVGQSERSFTTGPLPDGLPTWTTSGAPGWGAYTLFNHGTDRRDDRQSKLLIVDPEGRVRWYHFVPYDAPDLDAGWVGDGQVLYGGGYSAAPTIVDLAGRVVAAVADPGGPLDYHHHAERLPSGEVVTLRESTNATADDTWSGATIEIWDPTLTERTWTWDTQRGVDDGWLPVPSPSTRDPYHMNSVQVTDEVVYASFRGLDGLAAIDRGTGEVQWRLGESGDFALLDGGWFYGAHAPELDGEHLLVYDNGSGRPEGNFTRVVEYELDEAARTMRELWSWTEPGWYEPIWGDVDRLPDGHVLVTRAHCEVCASDEGTTRLLELDPETMELVWALVLSADDDAGYRAERLDGCAIFANGKYCPALR